MVVYVQFSLGSLHASSGARGGGEERRTTALPLR